MKSRRPSPLRDANGRLIARFADNLKAVWIAEDGTHLHTTRHIDIDELVRQHPFRSYRLRQVPGTISSIWIVPTDDPIPFLPIIQDMARAVQRGHGLLILATDAAARDSAKAFIERALFSVGVQ
jgi:hypothetical protein